MLAWITLIRRCCRGLCDGGGGNLSFFLRQNIVGSWNDSKNYNIKGWIIPLYKEIMLRILHIGVEAISQEDMLEKIQMRATKLILELRDFRIYVKND